ncbi:MAG: F0F1 ATP synthase subunit epsilon [Candidatus Nanopelagicales bacterium]
MAEKVKLAVRLVAMDRPLWSGEASIVVVVTPEGELGIMPGHEPVLATLVDGPVRIRTADGQTLAAVAHGGFFSVADNQVRILAETAELADEIDVERARRALDRILSDGVVDKHEQEAQARARVRLKAALGAESNLTR